MVFLKGCTVYFKDFIMHSGNATIFFIHYFVKKTKNGNSPCHCYHTFRACLLFARSHCLILSGLKTLFFFYLSWKLKTWFAWDGNVQITKKERKVIIWISNFTTLKSTHLLFQSFMTIREQYVLMAWLWRVFEGVDGKITLLITQCNITLVSHKNSSKMGPIFLCMWK